MGSLPGDASSDIIERVASLIIRRLEEEVKVRLRIRAAEHGHSMEEEAREILRRALLPEPEMETDFVTAVRSLFAPLGYVDDLEIPAREAMRELPKFGE
jgi:plasmid stability protein